jgi:hypothetical protein
MTLALLGAQANVERGRGRCSKLVNSKGGDREGVDME